MIGEDFMKWQPFGKKSVVLVEAFRKGCGGSKCVHIIANSSMSPEEAIRFSDTIIKAVKHTKKGIEWK